MTDQSTQADSPVPGADASVSDTSQDIQNKSDAGQDGAEEGDPEKAEPAKSEPTEVDKIRHATQKQIDKIYGRSKELERQLSEATAKLAKYEQSQQGLAEPKESDFDDPIEYGKALGKYEAEKAQLERQKQDAQAEQQTAQQRKMAKLEQSFKQAEATFKEQVPDYDATVRVTEATIGAADIRNPAVQAVSQAIIESDKAPDLLYHFGQHPEALEDLYEKSPVAAIKELMRIEAGLTAPKTQPPKAAPPTPVGAGGNKPGSKPLWELDGEAYRKARFGK